MKRDRTSEAAGKRLRHPGDIETGLIRQRDQTGDDLAADERELHTWWFFGSVSETEIVVNSRGVLPAANTLSLAASGWGSRVILHGVLSPAIQTTTMEGLTLRAGFERRQDHLLSRVANWSP